MADLALFALLIIVLVVVGVTGVIRARIERHGFLVLAWRWLSGHPWHGRALTDAGWVRPGSKALTRTGHASRFHHRPRLHRTGMRAGSALSFVLLFWGLVLHRAVTLCAAGALALAVLAWLALRSWRRVRAREHHRAWIAPLHVIAAPIVGIPLENSPGSWLHVEPDRKKATLTLPPGWHGTPAERTALTAVVTAKLGMERPEAKWRLQGPSHQVVFAETVPPPATASMADIRDAITRAKPRELVLGPGKSGKIVTVSLDTNSPHIGASMGSGAGKSTLGRLLLAQHLHHGGTGLVLDAKLFSHPWTWGLPNCAYADSPQLLHEALCWLGDELTRRNQVGKLATDVEGIMHAKPGASLMVLAEELNLTIPKLRAYWQGIGGQGRSPALQALEDVAFAGRQVSIHLVMIGQMLSARATGSGEARENVGIRILSRYTKRNWEMLAPEHPMPLSSDIDGRAQAVASGKVRETQIALATLGECRELALTGTVTPLPAGMPGKTSTPSFGPAPGELAAAVRPSQPVTLAEAVRVGVLPMSLAAARSARHRDPDFPAPAAMRGAAHAYDARQLAEYARSRL